MNLIKIIALLITTSASIVALFGETITRGKLNKKGYILLTLIIVGSVFALVLDFIQSREEKLNRKVALEWSMTEKQPIFDMQVSLGFRKELSPQDFINTAKLFSIKYTFREPNSIGRFQIKVLRISELDSSVKLKDRYQMTNQNDSIKNQLGASFYPYYKDDPDTLKKLNSRASVRPEGITIGASKELGSYYRIIGSSTEINGWIYSSDIELDWPKTHKNLCGFEATIPWTTLNSNLRLTDLASLTAIASFTIELPRDITLGDIDILFFTFHISDNQSISCDVKDFSEINKSDEPYLINFSGFQLYERLLENFKKKGGKQQVPISIR